MKYKNTSESDQMLVGFGVVPSGETIEVDAEISNPNFEPANKPGLKDGLDNKKKSKKNKSKKSK